MTNCYYGCSNPVEWRTAHKHRVIQGYSKPTLKTCKGAYSYACSEHMDGLSLGAIVNLEDEKYWSGSITAQLAKKI